MKMKILILVFLCQFQLFSQSIEKCEYFFNTDPGFGNGTEITVTSSDSVSVLDTIAINSLPNGFNKLGVRFMDSLDRWSLTFTRTFLKTFTDNSDKPRLIACEYFYNSDPGFGNGTEITLVAGDTVNILDTLAVNTLPNGFNKLGIRFKDSLDRWSQTFSRTFLKSFTDNSDKPRLIACEYFFNTDPGFGNGTEITLVASDTVNVFDTLVVNTLPNGFNKLGIRFKDSLDRWSQTFSRTFLKSFTDNSDKPRLIACEYFFNSDPGVGNGTEITVVADDTVNIFDTLAVNTLPNGFNKLGFRFKDSLDRWSQTFTRTFLKSFTDNSDKPRLIACEYFFNSDPGFGNGTEITIVADDTVNILDTIAVNTLPTGFNKLGIRFKDSLDRWSQTFSRTFLKSNMLTSESVKIVAAELVYDIEKGIGSGKPLKITKGYTINTIVIDSLKMTLDLGVHRFSLRVQDSLGRWSFPVERDFTVCEIDGALAGFDYMRFGNEVAFNDTSYNVRTRKWNFGDGTIDSTVNPLHRYTNAGIYNVKQTVENICGRDTLIAQVSITGIQDYFPKVVGDSGEVNLRLYGVGFTDSTHIKLTNNQDDKEIIPDTIFSNSNVCFANFKFNDAEQKKWNLNVEFPSDTTVIIPDALSIVSRIEPDIWVEIVSPPIIRTGRESIVTIEFGNAGNGVAKGVSLWLAVPNSFDVSILNEFYPSIDSLITFGDTLINLNDIIKNQFIEVDSLFGKPYDGKVYGLFLPVLLPGFNDKIELMVKSTTDQDISIRAWTNEPYYKNLLNEEQADCVFDLVNTEIGETPAGCMNGYMDLAFQPYINGAYRWYADSWDSGSNYFAEKYKVGNFFEGVMQSTIGCISDNPVLASKLGFTKGVSKTLDMIIKGWTTGGALSDCTNAFFIDSESKSNITSSSSYDPNVKFGPSNLSGYNYLQSTSTLPYAITFENLENATDAVQEVIIYDTLDKEYLDLTTFELKSFYFADRRFNIPPGLQKYSVDVDLRPGKDIILRISGQLDTLNGIAKWHFVSFDPKTMALTDDPILGFLEPNKNPPEGEGKVSYSIKTKGSPANGTVISNRANIVFDMNEPILTDVWPNTIDDDKPVSKVINFDGVQDSLSFCVNWSGTDTTSAIEYYNVYYSVNDGEFKLWQYRKDTTAAIFTGVVDTRYSFYSIGIDYAGNIENAKNESEASTAIDKMPVPHEWIPNETLDSATITVEKTGTNTFCNREMGKNDAIGFFYKDGETEKCAGFSYWESGKDFAITAWGDDTTTTEKDGFADKEKYNIKMWDAVLCKEIYVRSNLKSGNNYFTKDGSSVYSSIDAVCPETHTIPLAKGWNMISTYTQPENDSISVVLKPVVDNLVIAKNGAGLMYMPSKSIDLIKLWNVRQGYMVYMKDKDTLDIKGIPLPKDSLLYLAKGWNMIAYTRKSERAITTALAGLDSNFIIVKNGAGLIYLPSKNVNLIGNMKAGAGYLIYMKSADTLDYPDGSGKRTVDEFCKLPSHLKAKSSPYNMNLIVEADLLDEYEIGAYNKDNVLVGSGLVENGKAAVTIFADDENTVEVDGASADEAITFKAYNPKNDLYENFDFDEIKDIVTEKMLPAVNYTTNAVLTAKAATELKAAEDYYVNIYPNPTKNKIELQINFSEATTADVKVYDLQGNELILVFAGNLPQGETKLQINCETLPNGTYNVVIQMKDKSITKRFVVQR